MSFAPLKMASLPPVETFGKLWESSRPASVRCSSPSSSPCSSPRHSSRKLGREQKLGLSDLPSSPSRDAGFVVEPASSLWSSGLTLSPATGGAAALVSPPPPPPPEMKVYGDAVVIKRAAPARPPAIEAVPESMSLLKESYDRCRAICAEYAKTFYLGTLLMTPERRRAIWAIYVWCRRTDELVDGPNASHITPSALDRWEERLDDVFAGRPYDMLDAALSDTVSKFPVDIQPFKDMIEGMRMDLRKPRYNNFDELYLYCYYVAGTVGLMSVPVMGVTSTSETTVERVYNAALSLGIANQLTNILRDVGEDAGRGRIYLPRDELASAGLSDEDILAGKVTDKWRYFMKGQIERARTFFDEAEEGVAGLSEASQWPVWASLLLYRRILDEIEANDYDNFTKRAYVGKAKKLAMLPVAYGRSIAAGPYSQQRQPSLLKR